MPDNPHDQTEKSNSEGIATMLSEYIRRKQINTFSIIDEDTIPSQNYDPDSRSLEQQRKELANDRYKANTSNRNWLTEWAATTVTCWLAIVVGFLFLNKSHNIGLSDAVLNVLLGTTTLNILGLMYIVLKGYFNEKE